MTFTELRDTLTAVSDAVPVPEPDLVGFRRDVRRVRRRRTAGIVASTAAAVALVAGGSAVALSLRGDEPGTVGPAHDAARDRADDVPVLVQGHLRELTSDTVLGAEGPEVAAIVGTTAEGVVVLTPDDTLARVDGRTGELDQLVPGKVRSAYLDGSAVVYEDDRSVIHFWGITPRVEKGDSARTDLGRLWAAGGDVFVTSGASGLQVHTADAVLDLRFDHPPTVLHQVEVGGDVIAVRADDRVVFFDLSGRQLAEVGGGERLGALAPDGHAYVQPTTPFAHGLQLVDPETGAAERVPGPAVFARGDAEDPSWYELGWAPDGDLLVVTRFLGNGRELSRCAPDGSGCRGVLSDLTGTIRLGGVPL